MYSIKNCLIIGAGISGLMAANRLRANGVEVTLIDRGSRPGGRLATQKIGQSVFDYGAQFITTRERIFRNMVESWLAAGIVKPWYKGPLGNTRYVGIGGMHAVADHLAKDLKIHHSEEVTYLHFEKGGWTVTTKPAEGKKTKHYKADFLILTPPVPISLELIQGSNVEFDYDDEEQLKRVTYTKCITVLAQLDGPAGLSLPGAMDLNLDALRWLGDNSYKGISEVDGSLTINSSPRFAETHWDSPDEMRIPLILDAARPFIRAQVVDATAHRWHFSEPIRTFKEKQPFRSPYFIDSENRLAMCGDGFWGGRLEAAAMSGYSLGNELNRAV